MFSLDFALLKKLIYNFAFASVRAAKQVDLQADMYGILYYTTYMHKPARLLLPTSTVAQKPLCHVCVCVCPVASLGSAAQG